VSRFAMKINYQVPDDEVFRLQASGFGLQASGFRLQASGFRHRALEFVVYNVGSLKCAPEVEHAQQRSLKPEARSLFGCDMKAGA